MFDTLTEKFSKLFDFLSKEKKLTEHNCAEAIRHVRMALLEADVNYTVVKTLIERIKEKALGTTLHQALEPREQFITIVHEELITIMGSKAATIETKAFPTLFLLCGLQGAGKTTSAGKLAYFLKKQHPNQSVLLVGCDMQRPAAILQLKKLSEKIGCDFFSIPDKDPIEVVQLALEHIKQHPYKSVIFDTAGRLHIDEALMLELTTIKSMVNPHEVLFVANAAMGQDVVQTAQAFESRLGITGTIVTMLDGDTRGGAVISMLNVIHKPIKFEGIGEAMGDLRLFDPRSMADRILGMGDTIHLVKKLQEHVSEEDVQTFEKKMQQGSYTYGDLFRQAQQMKKMGPMQHLLKMLPGAKQADIQSSIEEFKKVEAMISSMTLREREDRDELSMSRMKRIAQGSGCAIEDVQKLKKKFKMMQSMFKGQGINQFKKMMRGKYGA